MGAGLILCFRQRGHGCRPGERAACQQGASLSDLFLQAQGPRTGCCSQLEHWTPQSLGQIVEGRQEGKGGWHSSGSGTQASWPQTRSQECDTPHPSTHIWDQLCLSAGLRLLISSGGPMEVQHKCPIMDTRAGSWHWCQHHDPRMLLFLWRFPCKTGSGGW